MRPSNLHSCGHADLEIVISDYETLKPKDNNIPIHTEVIENAFKSWFFSKFLLNLCPHLFIKITSHEKDKFFADDTCASEIG